MQKLSWVALLATVLAVAVTAANAQSAGDQDFSGTLTAPGTSTFTITATGAACTVGNSTTSDIRISLHATGGSWIATNVKRTTFFTPACGGSTQVTDAPPAIIPLTVSGSTFSGLEQISQPGVESTFSITGIVAPDGASVTGSASGTGHLTNPTFTVTSSGTAIFNFLAGLPCIVPSLPPVSETDQLFENTAPHAPVESLFFPSVEFDLDSRILQLTASLPLTRESGYRPASYQKHLHDIMVQAIDYAAATHDDPLQVQACRSLKSSLDQEIARHALKRGPNGLPTVALPEKSQHSIGPELGGARAVDLSGAVSAQELQPIAEQFGLYPACKRDSAIHLQKAGTECVRSMRGQSDSPVAIMIIDPQGQRVGFDRATGTSVNELGTHASYSGPDSEPQIIEINAPLPGNYSMVGTGTGTGAYTIRLQEISEDSEVQSEAVQTGQASPGMTFNLTHTMNRSISIDIKPESSPNVVVADHDGVISVAILAQPDFDAPRRVQSASLRFGPSGTEARARACYARDVNRDGARDLVCRFATRAAAFALSATEGILTGTLLDRTPIEGNDWIHLVRPERCHCDNPHHPHHDRDACRNRERE